MSFKGKLLKLRKERKKKKRTVSSDYLEKKKNDLKNLNLDAWKEIHHIYFFPMGDDRA